MHHFENRKDAIEQVAVNALGQIRRHQLRADLVNFQTVVSECPFATIS